MPFDLSSLFPWARQQAPQQQPPVGLPPAAAPPPMIGLHPQATPQVDPLAAARADELRERLLGLAQGVQEPDPQAMMRQTQQMYPGLGGMMQGALASREFGRQQQQANLQREAHLKALLGLGDIDTRREQIGVQREGVGVQREGIGLQRDELAQRGRQFDARLGFDTGRAQADDRFRGDEMGLRRQSADLAERTFRHQTDPRRHYESAINAAVTGLAQAGTLDPVTIEGLKDSLRRALLEQDAAGQPAPPAAQGGSPTISQVAMQMYRLDPKLQAQLANITDPGPQLERIYNVLGEEKFTQGYPAIRDYFRQTHGENALLDESESSMPWRAFLHLNPITTQITLPAIAALGAAGVGPGLMQGVQNLREGSRVPVSEVVQQNVPGFRLSPANRARIIVRQQERSRRRP